MMPIKFIAATKEYTTYENHIPAPLLRKSYRITRKVDAAAITICGLGFYELYINGRRITKGYFAPYISNPNHLLYYDTYDVTPYLRTGENVIGILLGNGNLNAPGGMIWDLQLASYRSAPKVAMSLELHYADQTREVIEADTSFKTHASPILFDDLRCGEIYDARKEIAGWNEPGFDDSEWNDAIEAETPKGEPCFCEAEPIVIKKSLAPMEIRKSQISILPNSRENLPVLPLEDELTGYLYDFGVNSAGNVRLRIKGRKGQKITMQFGELLAEDGGLDLRAMSFQPHQLNHRITYICKGEGEEEYFPHFTYQGFRYCLVQGITEEQATKELLTYEIMHSDIQVNGDFACSDEILNKIQAAAVNADLSNFYYFPTDCPHREKNGWTADAALSAEQMLFNLTPETSFREWLKNIRKAQDDIGAFPGFVPTDTWVYEVGPGWDSVIVYLPYYVWLYRGDEAIVKENAEAILKWFDYIWKRRDDKGLIHIRLGDWVPIGRSTPKTPLEVNDTLLCLGICKKAEIMFDGVGLQKEAQEASRLYDALRESARTYLIEPDGATVYGHSQTGQVLGIQYDLFEPAEKPAAFTVLMRLIRQNRNKMDVGCFGIRELFHVLVDFGEAELAYQMIVGPEYPSYGHWILEENATALFESFQREGDVPESKNHHFLGDVSSWFIRTIAGIKVNPYKRDCNEVEISPIFLRQLDWAKGYIHLKCGRLAVEWKRENENIQLKVEVPQGCKGLMKLPFNHEFSENGMAVCEIEEGTKNFRIETGREAQ